MREINALGLKCPEPLILAKRGIKQSQVGEMIEIKVDNQTSYENLLRYLAELGIKPESREETGIFTITFINTFNNNSSQQGVASVVDGRNPNSSSGANSSSEQSRNLIQQGQSSEQSTHQSLVDTVNPEQFCSLPTERQRGYVVVVKSLAMGDGDKDFSKLLMLTFLNTLTETDNLPEYVVLYNDGVRLATWEYGQSADALNKLESLGVKVLLCGACVDYYDLKGNVAVGQISNMYKIIEVLSVAQKVIYP